jgi:hypothetical protein
MVLAPASVPRNYHSIGLLLPDGRVFNGGGGLGGPSCGYAAWPKGYTLSTFTRTVTIPALVLSS